MHVCEVMCPTCVFRPGNLMDLRPGRLRGMVDEALADEGCVPCHERLRTAGCTDGDAVCRGFFDRYPTQPLQVAERLGLLREV